MARAWVSNPDYGKMVYEGRGEGIVPCLRCNKCHGRGPNDPYYSVYFVNPKLGIEHRLDILVSPPGPSERIAVIGGGEVGVETGMNFAKRGHSVTVLEMREKLAADTTIMHFRSMFKEAWEAIPAFHSRCGVTVTEITPDGVHFRNEKGEMEFIPATSVVISTGMKARREEALAFYGSAGRFHAIGDCKKPATVQQAMRDAFALAAGI